MRRLPLCLIGRDPLWWVPSVLCARRLAGSAGGPCGAARRGWLRFGISDPVSQEVSSTKYVKCRDLVEFLLIEGGFFD